MKNLSKLFGIIALSGILALLAITGCKKRKEVYEDFLL